MCAEIGTFSVCNDAGLSTVGPQVILEGRMLKRGNSVVYVLVLVKGATGTSIGATWEQIEDLMKRFTLFF